jgi:hypothetical protein
MDCAARSQVLEADSGAPTETLWWIIGYAQQAKGRLWTSSSSAARMTPPAQSATFSPVQAAWQTGSTPIERKSSRAFFRIVKLPQYARTGGRSRPVLYFCGITVKLMRPRSDSSREAVWKQRGEGA